MFPTRKVASLLIPMLVAALATGCNTSDTISSKQKQTAAKAEATTEGAQATADGTGAAEETAAPEKKELAKVINRPGKVTDKGTYIRVLVDNTPITNFDISRRAAFLKLRRVGGDRKKVAEQEMIDQAIKLSAARRANQVASDAQVDAAFANFAKQNRTNPKTLARELGKLGVGADHFKEFIRTQISWQTIVTRRFQSETQQMSQSQAIRRIRKSGEEKPTLAEYHFQRIVFVVPENKRGTLLKTRRTEANSFRQRFTSCDNTLAAAKQLRDVSVIEHRRMLEVQVPENWKEEIAQTEPGSTTSVKDTANGVEFLAVCTKKFVSDDIAAQASTQSKEFASFNEKGSALSEKYLDELRSRTTIIYR